MRPHRETYSPHQFKLGGMKMGDFFLGCPSCWNQYPTNAAGSTRCHCGGEMMLHTVESYDLEEIAQHTREGKFPPAPGRPFAHSQGFTVFEFMVLGTLALLITIVAIPSCLRYREDRAELVRQLSKAEVDPDYPLFLIWRKMQQEQSLNLVGITFAEWKELRKAGLLPQQQQPAR